MAKLTREEKIEIYKRRKKGETVSSLSKHFGIRIDGIKYLVRLIDAHGFDVLRKNKNRYYSPEFKEAIINRVLLDRESIISMAIEFGLSSDGLIHNWIKEYKENGYNIIEKKKWRPSMNKPKKIKDNLTPEEELKELKQKILYLEAENEYLKKLDVVVKQRVERQKKKKQK